jgi:hypothetical protein
VRQVGEEVEREIMGNVVTEEEVVKKKEGVEAMKRREAEASKDAGKSL